jgi:hypothetical protein
MRYMLKIPGTEATKVLHLTPEQQKDNTHFTDKDVINYLLFIIILENVLTWNFIIIRAVPKWN